MTAALELDGIVQAPLVDTLAMIREADLGPQAGDLRRWEVLERSGIGPFEERIFYISRVGFPFKDRAFHVRSRVQATDDGALVLTYDSCEPSRTLAEAAHCRWGTVNSSYRLRPLGPDHTELHRAIATEIGLPIPEAFLRRALARFYQANLRWMSSAGAVTGAFRARMAADPVYAWASAAVLAPREMRAGS